MTTHGPWNWNGTCLVAEPTRDYPNGFAVAKVFQAEDVPLIAAAPALLAALQKARYMVWHEAGDDAAGAPWKALLVEIDAAIANAMGGQP